jgi:Zn-dependent protease
MIRNAIRLGKVFGIEIGLDYSWFIIFVLITWSLAGHYLMVYQGWSPGFRLGLALVTALLFFISFLAHEFGHSQVANAAFRSFGSGGLYCDHRCDGLSNRNRGQDY